MAIWLASLFFNLPLPGAELSHAAFVRMTNTGLPLRLPHMGFMPPQACCPWSWAPRAHKLAVSSWPLDPRCRWRSTSSAVPHAQAPAEQVAGDERLSPAELTCRPVWTPSPLPDVLRVCSVACGGRAGLSVFAVVLTFAPPLPFLP